jgi:hypothetical protein
MREAIVRDHLDQHIWMDRADRRGRECFEDRQEGNDIVAVMDSVGVSPSRISSPREGRRVVHSRRHQFVTRFSKASATSLPP